MKVHDYEVLLSDLIAKRDTLNAAIAAVERCLKIGAVGDPPAARAEGLGLEHMSHE